MRNLLLNQQCYHRLLLAIVSILNQDFGALSWSKRPKDQTWKLLHLLLQPARVVWKLFLLVNKQSDVVSIVSIRESELASLDADFTTDAIHNIFHRSAKQGRSQDTSLPYTGGRREWLGEAAC